MLKKFDQRITEGALFTDHYQLLMAQLYFKNNLHEKIVQFDHYFRNYPDYGSHKAGYCINAGLEWLIDWLENTEFGDTEIEILKSHKNANGERLFHDDFLEWLKKNGSFKSLNIKSIPEGRVVHPNEPLTIVEGPAAIAQIFETVLLNNLNFQTLIATKASRIKEIAKGQILIDFGARRAQDRGAIAAVRAALIGGADYSSNVGISHLLGYPPKGTHSHSMVQLYLALGMTELDAFEAFANLYPDECVLLVDTINTIESGIPNAIKVFKSLKKKGHEPIAVRLDSGDLAYLSIIAVQMLDEAGLNDVGIVLSNELDEMNIWQIISQIREDAPKHNVDPNNLIKRMTYGVGTRLITSQGDPALGGVYKLVAVEDKNEWIPAIKISESVEKIPTPGNKQVYRIYDITNKATADLVSLVDENISQDSKIILRHPFNQTKKRILDRSNFNEVEPLLVDVYNGGKLVYNFPTIEDIRKQRESDLERLDTGVKRLIYPHLYHVSITTKIWKLRNDLIDKLTCANGFKD